MLLHLRNLLLNIINHAIFGKIMVEDSHRVETRFLKAIFYSTTEDLNYLINLIKKFESEFKHDLVAELVSMIIESDKIYLDSCKIRFLINITLTHLQSGI